MVVRFDQTGRSRVVLMAAGSVLCFAAAMKAEQAVSITSSVAQLRTVSWKDAVVTSVEAAVGIWLIFARPRRSALWICCLLFSLLAFTALREWAAGRNSCGCFGQLTVPPLATFVLDAFVVTALLFTWPILPKVEGARARSLSVIERAATPPFAILLGFVAALWVVPYLSINRARFADPSRWVGQTCPLLRYIDAPVDLATGKWILLLYNDRCGHCRAALADLAAVVTRNRSDARMPRVAIVHLGSESPTSSGFDIGWAQADCSLPAEAIDLIPFPLEVFIRDGVVVEVSNSDQLDGHRHAGVPNFKAAARAPARPSRVGSAQFHFPKAGTLCDTWSRLMLAFAS